MIEKKLNLKKMRKTMYYLSGYFVDLVMIYKGTCVQDNIYPID